MQPRPTSKPPGNLLPLKIRVTRTCGRGRSTIQTRVRTCSSTSQCVFLATCSSPIENLRCITQLFSKSHGSSIICGRIIEGRVLELYQELTDSPTKTLEEACVLSGIFALRYLSRDIAANVEPIDVSPRSRSLRKSTQGATFQYWRFGDETRRHPSHKPPTSPTREPRSQNSTHAHPCHDI